MLNGATEGLHEIHEAEMCPDTAQAFNLDNAAIN